MSQLFVVNWLRSKVETCWNREMLRAQNMMASALRSLLLHPCRQFIRYPLAGRLKSRRRREESLN